MTGYIKHALMGWFLRNATEEVSVLKFLVTSGCSEQEDHTTLNIQDGNTEVLIKCCQ